MQPTVTLIFLIDTIKMQWLSNIGTYLIVPMTLMQPTVTMIFLIDRIKMQWLSSTEAYLIVPMILIDNSHKII
jgi:hypothetical protein